MALKNIRLELARAEEFPAGSAEHGYEFVAPLDKGIENVAHVVDGFPALQDGRPFDGD